MSERLSMLVWKYDDGILELKGSCAVNGPSQVGGLHYGMSYLYARLAGGAWKLVTSRSLHKTTELCEAAENAAEAFEAITSD